MGYVEDGVYGSDFDETWWECWNLGPIDCNKFHNTCFSDDVIWRHSRYICLSIYIFDIFQRDNILWQREMIIMLFLNCDTSDSDHALDWHVML